MVDPAALRSRAVGFGTLLGRDVHRLHGFLTLTTVANVLVTMAIGPMITAIFACLPRQAAAVAHLAGHRRRRGGISWMFGAEAGNGASCSARWSLAPCRWPAPPTDVAATCRESGAQGPDMLPALAAGCPDFGGGDAAAGMAATGLAARPRPAGAARFRATGAALPVGGAPEPAPARKSLCSPCSKWSSGCLGVALGRRAPVVERPDGRRAGARALVANEAFAPRSR